MNPAGRVTCTRKLGWDMGHRVTKHESKCRNVHGHRYTVEVTTEADSLDFAGRVVDFGAVKRLLGAWIDDTLDHGYAYHPEDPVGRLLEKHGHKTFMMPIDVAEPTAENLAILLARVAQDLFDRDERAGLRVTHIRVWETPNCFADWRRGAEE